MNAATTARPGHEAFPTSAADSCLLSVVIVGWNTRELLRDCLASTVLAGRELSGAVEILVVDNASIDGTARMVADEFPDVKLIANASNIGFAAANNQGLRESRGRYLLLLNPDTKVAPSALSELVAFLESHPQAGAAGPRLVGGHGEPQVSCFPLPTLGREAWRLFHLDALLARGSYPTSRWTSDLAQRVESVQGACLLVRRSAFEQTGLLDERFFIYTEEIDLCRRLTDAGWQIFWIPQAVVVHYGGASTRQVGARMFLELYRSKIEYFRKHAGRWGAVAYKAVLLAASLPRIIVPAILIAVAPRRREEQRSLFRNYSTLLVRLPAL